jgi:hypothetical protein
MRILVSLLRSFAPFKVVGALVLLMVLVHPFQGLAQRMSPLRRGQLAQEPGPMWVVGVLVS